ATIWLIPIIENVLGWTWTFAFLAPGPILGIAAMMRLDSLLDAKGPNRDTSA
ncbi:MAG: hypothetical protein H0U16_04345, partial [Actinobacteria bacterium]|nr:hypothetical protein [Actinomycetota bacterium]